MAPSRLVIRNSNVFEFPVLAPQAFMSESPPERELLEKLQEFSLELGNGICFEGRQRRILIGDTSAQRED
jgi:predicted nuclease of restriction endonuclease-like (RecB) superfamily